MKYLMMLFTVFSFNAFSVCMTDMDAETYGCVRIKTDKAESGDKWCSKAHGEYFKSYFTDNICSKELAASLRGQTYKSTKNDLTREVPAACMSFEQGMKLDCEFYEFEAADRYCSSRYGARYLPFIPSNTCSLKKAAQLRGEKPASFLVKGLKSQIDEIETIMRMVDRKGVKFSLLGFGYVRPKVQSEFFTSVVIELMAKMNMFKETMKANGLHNIPLQNRETLDYLKYSYRYMGVLSRLYQVYAYVAHNNHHVLKTYKFKNLDYLNLVLKKKYALEILSNVNYMAKTTSDKEHVEFIVGTQERQAYEFTAVEKPDSKTDYAKAIAFLGARENLTNLWGVQRLSPTKIPNGKVTTCGNFLTLRPGKTFRMESSPVIKEMEDSDIFQNDYLVRMEDLIIASSEVSILNPETSKAMAYDVLKYTPELNRFLTEDIAEPLVTRADFKALASNDAPMYIDAENGYWLEFAYSNIGTIVMIGDDIQDKWSIKRRISLEAYKRRVKAIKDSFVSAYLWISDAGIKKLEKRIESYIDTNLRTIFMKELSDRLEVALTDYNDKPATAKKNRKEKELETLTLAENAVRAIYIKGILEKDEDFHSFTSKDVAPLGPETMEELMTYFQRKISTGYADVQATLEKSEDISNESADFFQVIGEKFIKAHTKKNADGNLEYSGTRLERETGLRQIFVEEAEKILKKYPSKYVPRTEDNINSAFLFEPTVHVADATYVDQRYINIDSYDFKPTYKWDPSILENSTPATTTPNTSDGTSNRFVYDYNQEVEHYIAKTDATYVHVNRYDTQIDTYSLPKLSFYSTQNVGVARDKGWNKDMMTTGELSAPLEVIDPGKIRTKEGVTTVNHRALLNLLAQYDGFSEKAKSALQDNKAAFFPALNFQKAGARPISDKRAFFARMFNALGMTFYTDSSKPGHFANSKDGQTYFAAMVTSRAYQVAPILRSDYTWSRTTTSTSTGMGNYGNDFQGRTTTSRTTTKHSRELGKKIMSDAWNKKTDSFDKDKAATLIHTMFTRAISNTGGKLADFCKANYLNYKNSSSFKKIYNASAFLRLSLRSGVGQTDEEIAQLEEFDEEMRKELRTGLEAWNEDYGSTLFEVLGWIALAAIAVVAIIGSAGAAAPGIIGGIYAVASATITVEFVIGACLASSLAITRINTNFIEVPAQLKFQESIAMSQLGDSKIVDWDMLDEGKKQNSTGKSWAIPLTLLDFFYGAAVIRSGVRASGVIGKKAMKRLTGIKLKGFSAPVKSMKSHVSFFKLRKKIGSVQALKAKFKSISNNIMMYTPRFQAVPPSLIKSTSLRMGFAKAATKAGVASKPWTLLSEIRTYATTLKSRITVFKKYSIREGKILETAKLNKRMTFNEFKGNIQHTKLAFIPMGLRNAIDLSLKRKSVKPFFEFFTNFGEGWKKIKYAQGEMVKHRANKIDNVVSKLDDFEKANAAGHVTGQNKMTEFLKTLTDDEILVLEEISRRSQGTMRVFKPVFKDYKKVIQGLKPIAYAHGFGGREFAQGAATYPSHLIMNDFVDGHTIKNEADDLLGYYESMMKNHGDNSPQMKSVREEIESWFEKEYKFDADGVAQSLH